MFNKIRLNVYQIVQHPWHGDRTPIFNLFNSISHSSFHSLPSAHSPPTRLLIHSYFLSNGYLTLLHQMLPLLLPRLSHSHRLYYLSGARQAPNPCFPLPQFRLLPWVRQVGWSQPSIPSLLHGGWPRRDCRPWRLLSGECFAGSYCGQRCWLDRKRFSWYSRWPSEESAPRGDRRRPWE